MTPQKQAGAGVVQGCLAKEGPHPARGLGTERGGVGEASGAGDEGSGRGRPRENAKENHCPKHMQKMNSGASYGVNMMTRGAELVPIRKKKEQQLGTCSQV